MNQQTSKYSRKRIKNNVLIFGFLHKITSAKGRLLTITIIGIIMGLFGVLLLQNTGLYALGLESFGQGLGNLAYYLIQDKRIAYIVFNLCFWLIYFILNIPLLILSWKKISKTFTWYTCYYLLIFTVAGISFGFVPSINKVYLFSDLLHNTPAIFQKDSVRIILWNYDKDSFKHIAVFLYSICWGLLQGLAAVSVIILAGSTGGFDILGMYIAKVKLRDIGSIFFILNILTLTFANIIGTFLPASLSIKHGMVDHNFLELNKPFSANIFFSPNFVSGFFMLLMHAFIVNFAYPKYKLVQIQIFCTRPFELINIINEKSQRQFTFSVIEVWGAYSRKKQFMITTNAQYFDIAYLFELVRKIEPQLFMSLIDIKKGDGYMFVEE
ncbi:DUF2179 domain-containing protein [Mycoplasma sp. NEAQ87857]|uniref:YitT family protein n=1 Tax=Mycoplasma sp. NEAQ87857 TaxID=2683967 RepID=UPI0013183E76|nr:YitT family protein [Mycoplasma sp. NEAQ87857]QGZ97344.1 DUF2179 domain-containing protein [Mycoplasma sp. NEAQ87857]